MKQPTPIALIIQLLQTHPFKGISEEVEIAKGKYEFITTWSQVKNQFKRRLTKWQKP